MNPIELESEEVNPFLLAAVQEQLLLSHNRPPESTIANVQEVPQVQQESDDSNSQLAAIERINRNVRRILGEQLSDEAGDFSPPLSNSSGFNGLRQPEDIYAPETGMDVDDNPNYSSAVDRFVAVSTARNCHWPIFERF